MLTAIPVVIDVERRKRECVADGHWLTLGILAAPSVLACSLCMGPDDRPRMGGTVHDDFDLPLEPRERLLIELYRSLLPHLHGYARITMIHPDFDQWLRPRFYSGDVSRISRCLAAKVPAGLTVLLGGPSITHTI